MQEIRFLAGEDRSGNICRTFSPGCHYGWEVCMAFPSLDLKDVVLR